MAGRGWQGIAAGTLSLLPLPRLGANFVPFLNPIFELFLLFLHFLAFLASKPPTKQPAKIKAGSRGWRAGVGHRQAEMHFHDNPTSIRAL
jgi:hypothetical protein